MKIRCGALMLCVSAMALAQGITGVKGVFASVGPAPVVTLLPYLRVDPPNPFPQGLAARMRGHGMNGKSFLTRYIADNFNHVLFGYDLLIEEQQPGTYLATFGKLGMTPLELSMETIPGAPGIDWTEWTTRPVPAIPQPRLVHDGDTISIDLFVDAATGQKLIDEIRIQARSGPAAGLARPPAPPAPNGAPSGPVVSGNARDFSAADAELYLARPRVTLNGTLQDSIVPAQGNARGSLVWFYLPDHGRYVLSLAPRPDLDFKKAGEVRGSEIILTLGEDTIKLECTNAVATGDVPYYLYVLRDPEWEPTAQAQKGRVAVGTVGTGELLALKRK